MAKRVFFSFHYQRDIWRANQVRNSWVTKGGQADGRFYDASLWEETKKKGDDAVRKLIDEGLKGTSATAVLIGRETSARRWVDYEIEQSWQRGNSLIGIGIHALKDKSGLTDLAGGNPFEKFTIHGGKERLSAYVPIYDWVADNGYENLPSWLDKAPSIHNH